MFPQTLYCPAKVNWTLKVGPKQASGFHRVETLMLALELQDTLHLFLDPEVPKGSMRLSITGPANSGDIPLDESNLILRAARLVTQRFPERYGELVSGVSFELEKHIPSQAGLGGGSSNAAAAAYCLALGLGIEFGSIDVLDLLAELGSDCPFFAHVLSNPDHPAFNTNTGLGFDQGQRILRQEEPAPDLFLCVITPGVGCPTGRIYGALDHPREGLPAAPQAMDWNSLKVARCNDLEAAALTGVPELAPWRRALSEFDAQAFQLSGSGSSFYGVVPPDREHSEWLGSVLAHLAEAELQPRFHWSGALWRSPQAQGWSVL